MQRAGIFAMDIVVSLCVQLRLRSLWRSYKSSSYRPGMSGKFHCQTFSSTCSHLFEALPQALCSSLDFPELCYCMHFPCLIPLLRTSRIMLATIEMATLWALTPEQGVRIWTDLNSYHLKKGSTAWTLIGPWIERERGAETFRKIWIWT
jgi:hypothetical protein